MDLLASWKSGVRQPKRMPEGTLAPLLSPAFSDLCTCAYHNVVVALRQLHFLVSGPRLREEEGRLGKRKSQNSVILSLLKNLIRNVNKYILAHPYRGLKLPRCSCRTFRFKKHNFKVERVNLQLIIERYYFTV